MIEAAVKRRVPIPEAIASAPSLFEGLEIYYEAFSELSTCRHETGPIPWTAMDRYGERHDFRGEEFDRLVKMVRALDDCFLAIMATKKEKANGKP